MDMESAAELRSDESRFESDSGGKYRGLRVSTSTPCASSYPSFGENGPDESRSFEDDELKSVKSCVPLISKAGGLRERGRLDCLDRPLGGSLGEESGALDCCEYEGICV